MKRRKINNLFFNIDKLNLGFLSLDSSQRERDGYHIEKKHCDFRVSEIVLKKTRGKESKKRGQCGYGEWEECGIFVLEKLNKRDKNPDYEGEPGKKGWDSSFRSYL